MHLNIADLMRTESSFPQDLSVQASLGGGMWLRDGRGVGRVIGSNAADHALDLVTGSNGVGALVLGGVLGLDLVGLAGEDDQASLVGLEALDIGGEALLGEVLATGIDGDTDGGSVKLGDTGSLKEMLEIGPECFQWE